MAAEGGVAPAPGEHLSKSQNRPQLGSAWHRAQPAPRGGGGNTREGAWHSRGGLGAEGAQHVRGRLWGHSCAGLGVGEEGQGMLTMQVALAELWAGASGRARRAQRGGTVPVPVRPALLRPCSGRAGSAVLCSVLTPGCGPSGMGQDRRGRAPAAAPRVEEWDLPGQTLPLTVPPAARASEKAAANENRLLSLSSNYFIRRSGGGTRHGAAWWGGGTERGCNASFAHCCGGCDWPVLWGALKQPRDQVAVCPPPQSRGHLTTWAGASAR